MLGGAGGLGGQPAGERPQTKAPGESVAALEQQRDTPGAQPLECLGRDVTKGAYASI